MLLSYLFICIFTFSTISPFLNSTFPIVVEGCEVMLNEQEHFAIFRFFQQQHQQHKHPAIYSPHQNYHSNLDKKSARLKASRLWQSEGELCKHIFRILWTHKLSLSYIIAYFDPDLMTENIVKWWAPLVTSENSAQAPALLEHIQLWDFSPTSITAMGPYNKPYKYRLGPGWFDRTARLTLPRLWTGKVYFWVTPG